ncbi:ribonuclease J [Spirochaetota bacterium]|nr:ribonuclease J [Spirochaetota bacterium]
MKNIIKKTGSTKVVALGGLEEFGNNCILFEYADNIIIIDYGLKFNREPTFGMNYLIPDMRYLKNNISKVKALICTHGHLDHIGGVHFLIKELSIPIYTSNFTAMLIHQAFKEIRKTDYELNVIEVNKKIEIGPFMIEPVYVDHSIPDACALVIETPTGIFVHSGDFRHDLEPFQRKQNKFEAFEKYAGKKCVALFSDSTNAVKKGHSITEMTVYRNLEKLFKSYSTRLVFSTFSTQIERIKKILDLALKYDRVVFFLGKSMLTNLGIAAKGKLLDKYENTIKPLKSYNKYPPKESVLIVTGSQGEEKSALIKLATKQHRQLRLSKEDVIVFSSSVIPGNELSVSNLINKLLKNGNTVITNDDLPIHTSGHGYAEELAVFIKKIKPKFFFPIHGNYLNLLKHKELALKQGLAKEDVFIIENGQKLELFTTHVKILEKIRTRPTYIENGQISDCDELVLQQRKKISESGVLILFIHCNHNRIENIFSEAIGVTSVHNERKLLTFLTEVLRDRFAGKSFDDNLKNKRRGEKKITSEVKNILYEHLKITPVVKVALYMKS